MDTDTNLFELGFILAISGLVILLAILLLAWFFYKRNSKLSARQFNSLTELTLHDATSFVNETRV